MPGRPSRRAFLAVTLVAAASLVVAAASCSTPDDKGNATPRLSADDLRINQLQMVATHNSYHVAPAPDYLAKLESTAKGLGESGKALGDVTSLDYTHAPLTTQLDRGTRSFELDVWADPVGGLFSHPLAPDFLQVASPIPTGLDKPGFKVLHIVDIDFISTCQVFVGCLQEMKAWSDAHPRHIPIVVLVELKDDPLPKPVDVTKVVPIDAARMDALDAEIRSVLPADRLITPDLVRGSSATLRDAVSADGWPRLGDVRGRFMFMMDNADPKRSEYLEGHESLNGRVLFTSSGKDQPDGAVLKENDPGSGADITGLVKQGYFVRTRSDADLVEGRSNDSTRRTAAMSSGAQIVSTDFPVGEPAATGYDVEVGTSGVQVRCNPVALPADQCPDGPIE